MDSTISVLNSVDCGFTKRFRYLQGQIPAIIFLDIKKAFDTVNHEIFIEKLNHYCINGTVILWFINYLSGRYQCTKMGNLKAACLDQFCSLHK
jgi:hypothetical protein